MNEAYSLHTAELVIGTLLICISGVGTVFAGLVRRSVAAQDEKLGSLIEKVDAITERVSDHASRLAESKAEIRELARRAEALEAQVRDVSIHGCARACVPGVGK